MSVAPLVPSCCRPFLSRTHVKPKPRNEEKKAEEQNDNDMEAVSVVLLHRIGVGMEITFNPLLHLMVLAQ